MDYRHDEKCSEDHHRVGESANKQEISRKIIAVTKTIRAMTAITFFGIPVVIGTATIIGYGIHKVYKWTTGRS